MNTRSVLTIDVEGQPTCVFPYAGRHWFTSQEGCYDATWRSNLGDVLTARLERAPVLNGHALPVYGEVLEEILVHNGTAIYPHLKPADRHAVFAQLRAHARLLGPALVLVEGEAVQEQPSLFEAIEMVIDWAEHGLDVELVRPEQGYAAPVDILGLPDDVGDLPF
jgi:hypothetical protein